MLVNDVHFDSHGNLWLATQTNGVFKYNNGRWINFKVDNSGLTTDKILSIFEDHKGIIWVTTQGGDKWAVCFFKARSTK